MLLSRGDPSVTLLHVTCNLNSTADKIKPDTHNGCVCLEALVPKVSVPVFGRGFDGRSGHAFRVKPSTSGDMRRSYLQLRPGESFYIQDLAFALIPEGQHDDLVRLASCGTIPSYEEYSQHISQKVEESQACLTPSPRKTNGGASFIDAPTKCTIPGQTPIVYKIAADAIDEKEDSQEWPLDPEKRTVLHTLRDVKDHGETENLQHIETRDLPSGLAAMRRTSTVESCIKPQVLDLEETAPFSSSPRHIVATGRSDIPVSPHNLANDDTQESIELQVSGDHKDLASLLPSRDGKTYAIESACPQPTLFGGPGFPSKNGAQRSLSKEEETNDEETNDEEPHAKKRRRPSLSLKSTPAEESQDSLAGNSIAVDSPVRTPSKDATPQILEKRRPSTSTSTQPAANVPQTPSTNATLKASPHKSLDSTSSTRGLRSIQGARFQHHKLTAP